VPTSVNVSTFVGLRVGPLDETRPERFALKIFRCEMILNDEKSVPVIAFVFATGAFVVATELVVAAPVEIIMQSETVAIADLTFKIGRVKFIAPAEDSKPGR
jgi:hypothetical protein